MNHGGMDMGGSGEGAACKISMLWNWYTIDACFLASGWHIRSTGGYVASCVGTALLVVCLEALKRLMAEHDAWIARRYASRHAQRLASGALAASAASAAAASASADGAAASYRISLAHQAARAALHAVTFGLGYLIMLLAMYFNGGIILSIIAGAALGKLLCDWGVAHVVVGGSGEAAHGVLTPLPMLPGAAAGGAAPKAGGGDLTMCCA